MPADKGPMIVRSTKKIAKNLSNVEDSNNTECVVLLSLRLADVASSRGHSCSDHQFG